MATAIINEQMDAINESFSNISSDLTTIRPLLKNASIGAYPTDSASGSIASFTDGAEDVPVKELKVNLEPIQDLNGYDNPWPAGGGKNLYDDSTIIHGSFTTASVTTNSNEAYRTVKLTLPAGTYTFSCDLANCFIIRGVWDGAVYAINWGTASYTFTSTEEGTVAFCIRNTSTSTITDTVHAQVEIGSTATDYAPYSNICPISGHTEVNVYRTGKNLWSFESAYSKTSSGTILQLQPLKLKAGTYTLSMKGSIAAAMAITIRDASGATLTSQTINSSQFVGGAVSRSFTLANDSATINIYSSGAYDLSDIQLELGSTATDYEPYAGQTYPISLGQTVYGGTLNVTTGVLTVDRAEMTLDGTEAWGSPIQGSSYVQFTFWLPRTTGKPSATSINSTFPLISLAERGTKTGLVSYEADAGYRFALKTDMGISTAEQWKTWLSSNPVQLCYELATPITVQLTATQVSTLLGDNNIWSDSGSVSVLYRADVGLYIDKKLAQALSAV